MVSQEQRALAEKAVQAAMGDTRTPNERLVDGAKFVMGPDPANGGDYYAEHRCIPCGNASWNKLPDTSGYSIPACCGKNMMPTGRVQKDGYLLSTVSYRKTLTR